MLRSLASYLPTEILDHICCDISSPSDLFPLLLTNSVVHPIAARVLYRDLVNLSKIQTVHLLQSLSKPPHPSNDKYLPSRHDFVKNLEINFDDSTLLMSLLTMIRQTLERLPNLKSLLIEFSSSDNRRPLARFFPLNAPFKLRYLTTSVRLLFTSNLFFCHHSSHRQFLIGMTLNWPCSSTLNPKSRTSHYVVSKPRQNSNSTLTHSRICGRFALSTQGPP